MGTVNLFIDLLKRQAVRGIASAAPAPMPDFRSQAAHTLNAYFLQRSDALTENYAYTRYASGTPQAKLRRNKAPDYCTFVLSFLGYDTPVIDARLPLDSIALLISSIASIGKNNIQVTGSYKTLLTIEFVNGQGGVAQPSFTGRVITPANGELIVRQISAGGVNINAKYTIQLREAPLASATGWAETGVPATPGWTATLDTTSIPSSMWDDGTMILEVTMEGTGVRTGADGVTSLEGATRSAADGQIVGINALTAQTALPFQGPQGDSHLVARDGLTVYGRLFQQSDVGRSVSDVNGFIVTDPNGQPTRIASVINTDSYNGAVLDTPLRDGIMASVYGTPAVLTYDLGAVPSRIYKSATAAFVASDVGHVISGDNLALGTKIESIIAADTVKLDTEGLLVGTGFNWTITAIPGNLFVSAGGSFGVGDIGARIEAPQLPAGTYVTGFPSANTFSLSQKALGVAASQAWTLRPKRPFTAPSVSSFQTGTPALVEKQRVVFVQSPIGGQIAIRDGADLSLPYAYIDAPVTRLKLESALNLIYPNYGGVIINENIPNGQFEITWGVNGQQHILIVDDTAAIYPTRVLQLPVGEPPDEEVEQEQLIETPVPGLNRFNVLGLTLLGVNSSAYKIAVTTPIRRRMNDGSFAYEIRQRYAVVQGQLGAEDIGERVTFGGQQFYLDRYENVEHKGGLTYYDWIGYTLPTNHTTYIVGGNTVHANRVERGQQMRSYYGVARSYLGQTLVDIQLYSASTSTFADAIYTYFIPNDYFKQVDDPPPNSPAGVVIHFVSVGGFTGVTQLIPLWGFDSNYGTFGQFVQSWARRRWKANIWEQVMFYN
jgi:hypothetical protein